MVITLNGKMELAGASHLRLGRQLSCSGAHAFQPRSCQLRPSSITKYMIMKILETWGSLNKTSKNIRTGLVGAPACRDVLKLQIQVDEKGMILDARFKMFDWFCNCLQLISH